MQYQIVSDLPGRIRVRYGTYAFTNAESKAISNYFLDFPWIEDVTTSYMNGSVLIFYHNNFRDNMISSINDLKIENLTIVSEDHTVAGIDAAFRTKIYGFIFKILANQLLVPLPIRKLLIIKHAFKKIAEGLKYLARREVTVEVLDASAVAVSLFQGHFATASGTMRLLELSELLEEYTRKRTKLQLSESLSLNIDTVWVQKEDGTEVSVPISTISMGDHIIVRSGAMIPVDGQVMEGEAGVNQSSMTGEPLAVLKRTGDSVFAGTVLEEGQIVIKVYALADKTRISQIVDLIDQSEQLKAGIQAKAERMADRIVPFSFLLAAGVFAFTGNLRKSLSVLLVDYSCAIKLATPMSVISAIREASTHKIMVKGGKYLEAMAEADIIVFDKTGTLTIADPKVQKIMPFEGWGRDDVLRTAACLEEHFPHSVARAVVKKALEENLHHEEHHAEVDYMVAHGIATYYQDKRVVIGSYHFVVEDEGIALSPEQEEFVKEHADGDSVIYLGVAGKPAGFICITDPPRAESKEVIAHLRTLGIRQTIMITGDGESTAKVVANELGIDQFFSQVLPEQKAAIIKELKAKGHKIIMVGDGINDSPALAEADVSISLKSSSDIAREVADMTLLSDSLKDLVTIRLLSQKLMSRIQNNFKFILSFNTALLALGLTGVIMPAASAILHNMSTMGISAASMRPCLSENKSVHKQK